MNGIRIGLFAKMQTERALPLPAKRQSVPRAVMPLEKWLQVIAVDGLSSRPIGIDALLGRDRTEQVRSCPLPVHIVIAGHHDEVGNPLISDQLLEPLFTGLKLAGRAKVRQIARENAKIGFSIMGMDRLDQCPGLFAAVLRQDPERRNACLKYAIYSMR